MSVIGILLAVIFGGLVIFAGSQGSVEDEAGVPVFAICGVTSFVINWAAFIPAYFLHTEKFYDLTGALTHITVIIIGVYLSWPTVDYRGLIVAGCVILWATRLGTFLFLRIHGAGLKDWRFDKIKHNFKRFLLAWTLQALWVIMNTTATLALITSRRDPDSGAGEEEGDPQPFLLFDCGVAIWLCGSIYEVVADEQKRQWRKDPNNKGKWIDSGLWSYSRHPNYFGEITLWFGLALASVPVLSGFRWAMLISPVFCGFLLCCVSGIPFQNAKAKKQWGENPEWRQYMASTSALIPGPRLRFSSKKK